MTTNSSVETERRSVQMRPAAGHGEKRSRRQERAIAALLECDTVTEAASRSRIAKTTLLRWLGEPEFHARYAAARRRLLDAAISKLRRIARDAGVDVLEAIARDSKVPAAARVSAARAVLDSALRASELQDVLERVDNLERKFGGPK